MKFNITTDRAPKTIGEHKNKNWESPLMDKFNAANDFLIKLNMGGKLSCDFNSVTQTFSPNVENCEDLSKEKIKSIIQKLNNF